MQRYNCLSAQTSKHRTANCLGYKSRFISKQLANFIIKITLLTAISSVFLSSGALAHHAEVVKDHPFLQGLSMPIHSVSYIILVLGICFISFRFKIRKAVFAIPTVFSLLTLLGGLLNISGIKLPYAEFMVFISTLIIGSSLILNRPLLLLYSSVIAGLSTLTIGNMMIQAAKLDISFLSFSAGFFISTILLVTCGIMFNSIIQRYTERNPSPIYVGVFIVAMGILIYLFPPANEILIYFLER
jgi:urease accessory protein